MPCLLKSLSINRKKEELDKIFLSKNKERGRRLLLELNLTNALDLDKLQADIANQRSETERNVPEMEHLKSETILNLAKAREAGSKAAINTRVQ